MKIINNIKNNLGIIAVILLVMGCQDKLDLAPETQISDSNFWNSTTDLEKAANYLYTFLPDIESATDNSGTFSFSNSGANSVSDGTRIAPATDTDNWDQNYDIIRASNNILEKSVNVSGDEATINKYLAEARFFRAWAYFEMVKRFGGVPLITKTLGVSDPELYAPRAERSEVVSLIYQDLDFAISHLPMPSKQAGAEYGRITASAALSFKSRVALFEGTRAKFHGGDDAQKHLQLAMEAAEEVINSGEHGLFKYGQDPAISYRKLFHDEGDGPSNPESIMVKLYGENASNNLRSHRITENRLNQGQMVPTKALADLYLYTDGLPKEKSANYGEEVTSLTQFESRDPRMEMTIFNKTLFYTPTALYVPGFQFSPSGYKFCKYFNPEYMSPPDCWVDFMIIRYAEVLLNYAEAKFELTESISDSDLDKSINLLRERVGMPALSNQFVNANSLSMREEIRRERGIELAMENFQYWDLIRWKTAEVELPQTILGAKYFEEEYGPTANEMNADGYVIVQKEVDRHFDPSRDYLWPIPLQELGLNPALEQNPNW
ncbi:RagB/SusD family nutrient uptake outer membrane protein [Echinicola soli]|uniref:RagB/SusD family nutrient uptake outer membrane protein n=1 Tax=Echinicola soli TaxID=2591634 RepID=A0A514CHV1_9BACT|nr:RagB/SusD family nutrient uptake outer membrane protein [Echinicola soli]QDH79403.1 RagB/SusD family nutrient uptake outer membrane protein [Echinicola soli]